MADEHEGIVRRSIDDGSREAIDPGGDQHETNAAAATLPVCPL